MTKIFDWSSLDRNLLVSIIKTAAPTIVGSAVLPVDFSKHLKQIFKFFDIPINIKTTYNKITKQDTIWIGGMYESDSDEESKNPITIITQFNQKGKTKH